MKPKLLLCLALALSGSLLMAQDTNSSVIKITFAKPFVAPSRRIWQEALLPHGCDAGEHGAFTNIVAGRISELNVTWANSKYFKTEDQIQDFSRELLKSAMPTWTYHVWQFGDTEPMLVTNVQPITGKQGKLFVWFYPRIYWAYLDESGKWWWCMDKTLKVPIQKP